MDTTSGDAGFWTSEYIDYLRDVAGTANATRARYMPCRQQLTQIS